MKAFKLFLFGVLLSLGVHASAMVVETNRARGLVVTEAIGLGVLQGSSLACVAKEFVKDVGFSCAASLFLHELEYQQSLEIESLIAVDSGI